MRNYPAPKKPKFNSLRFFVVVLVIGYLFSLVGKTVYQNYKFNNEVQAIADEITAIEKRNEELKSNIEYFKTDEFKEIQAREKLNKQKPGETVVVITPDKSQAPKVEVTVFEPNYVKWWKFLTNRLEI